MDTLKFIPFSWDDTLDLSWMMLSADLSPGLSIDCIEFILGASH